jgi:hypothetical protein
LEHGLVLNSDQMGSLVVPELYVMGLLLLWFEINLRMVINWTLM